MSEAEIAAARARLEQANRKVTMLPESPRLKYQHWKALDRQVQLGALLTEEERTFHEAFARTADFRAFRRMEETLERPNAEPRSS